jgi:hypothetical protein
MVKILETGALSPEMRELTVEELHRKCHVLIHGFRKRGKEEAAREYEEIAARYTL